MLVDHNCTPETCECNARGLLSVLMIRCTKHLTVPQQNVAEDGGECGGCIAEQLGEALKRISTFEESSSADTRTINRWAANHAALEARLRAVIEAADRMRDWVPFGSSAAIEYSRVRDAQASPEPKASHKFEPIAGSLTSCCAVCTLPWSQHGGRDAR